jgi:hypothetical protein
MTNLRLPGECEGIRRVRTSAACLPNKSFPPLDAAPKPYYCGCKYSHSLGRTVPFLKASAVALKVLKMGIQEIEANETAKLLCIPSSHSGRILCLNEN